MILAPSLAAFLKILGLSCSDSFATKKSYYARKSTGCVVRI